MPRLIRTQRGPPVPTDTRTTLRQRGPQPLHGYVELRPQVSRTRPVTARPQLIGQRQRTAGRLTLPPHLRRAVPDDMGDGSDSQIVSEISATDHLGRISAAESGDSRGPLSRSTEGLGNCRYAETAVQSGSPGHQTSAAALQKRPI
jgi:hypothetical protein